jgi:hypothetical protein
MKFLNRIRKEPYLELWKFSLFLIKIIPIIFIVYNYWRRMLCFFFGDSTYVPIKVLGKKFILIEPKDNSIRKQILEKYRKTSKFSHNAIFLDEATKKKILVLTGDSFTKLLKQN